MSDLIGSSPESRVRFWRLCAGGALVVSMWGLSLRPGMAQAGGGASYTLADARNEIAALIQGLAAETSARVRGDETTLAEAKSQIAPLQASLTFETNARTAAEAALKEADAKLAAPNDRLTAALAIEADKLVHVSRDGNELFITNANLYIRSGSGSTEGPVNGFGNLVVGYHEQPDGWTSREGSHNLIVGSGHNYWGYGGVVFGRNNVVAGKFNSVTGGEWNKAIGDACSIAGGFINTAEGWQTCIGGGGLNYTHGFARSIQGGAYNKAEGNCGSGGLENNAAAFGGTVSGGRANRAEGEVGFWWEWGKPASANYDFAPTVSGGRGRSALDAYDWAAGGLTQAN